MSIRFLAEGEKPERDPELALGVEASTESSAYSSGAPVVTSIPDRGEHAMCPTYLPH
jgi:hypothetical protein